MKSSTLLVSTTLGSLLVLCTACGTSGDDDSSGGAGGLGASAGGSGGATASGGTSATTTGGVTGAGGSVTTSGGLTSAGGSPAGGATASGGANPVTGGTTGAGGTTVGGTTGSGGATLSGGNTGVGGGTTGTGGRGRGGGTGVGGATGTTGGGTGVGGSTDTTGGTSAGGTTGTTGGSTGAGGATSTDVTVQLAQTRQTIDGFGINNNWAPAMTDAVADALFDPDKGIGLTILRIGMGSNGEHFNSSSPQDIQKAKARGAKYIIGSTWSPPGDWKQGQSGGATSENGGGHLKKERYEDWASRIANFASTNSLYAMSPGNEPDFASCGMNEPCNGDYPTTLYTASEMVEFIKVLGPKLKSAGVKLLGPEASEWLHNWSNVSACCSEPGGKPSSDPLKCGCFTGKDTPCASTCSGGGGYDYGHALYADKTAWAALDIMGVHQYDTQVAEPWPADVPEKKPIWQTEMSGVKWWPEQGPSTDIKNGVATAGWFHNALTVGEANAWLWWWYNGTSTNEGLYNNGTDTKRHYTYGNYTKFIRPGYVRVDVTGNVPADVLLSAYKGTDGTVVVVAINKGGTNADVPITIAGGTAPATMTPNVTSSADNLKAGTAVTVTGGTFTASLPTMTVTTFVGK